MNTGEDTQSLRKIVEFTRLISIFILSIHFYICCYAAFKEWGCNAEITDRLISNIAKTGLFDNLVTPKLATLLFLAISLLGVKGKKDEKIQKKTIIGYILGGLILYFASVLCLLLPINLVAIAILYMSLTSLGYMLTLSGGGLLSRLIKDTFNKDVFNADNESFPQEERLLQNEYSINLPAVYNLKGRIRKSYISIINPFRGLLVSGTPGSR